MRCLSIECVTRKGEVSIVENNHALATSQLPVYNGHAKDLAPAIYQMMHKTRLKLSDLDAVCVDSGPGSYTGIRVGIAYSKSISLATGLPIYAGSSLKAMAYRFFQKYPGEQNVVVIMDAKWDELYVGTYSNKLDEINPPDIMAKDNLVNMIRGNNSHILYNPENISELFTNKEYKHCVYPDSVSIAILAQQEKLEPHPIYVRKITPQLKNRGIG